MFSVVQDLVNFAPLGIPAFLFVITLVIFFHELGHFLMARAFGVSVETFSIGFGGEIFGWTDKKGTRWKVSWLPLGGYVKFMGDENAASTPDHARMAQMTEAEKAKTLPYKPLWQRALVIAAGPAANFVFAFIVFAGLLAFFGAQGLSTYVGGVVNKSPAAEAGLKPGDKIVAVDGKPVKLFVELQSIVHESKGQPLDLTVERNQRTLLLHVTPRTIDSKDIFGGSVKAMAIGVAPAERFPENLVYLQVPLVKVPQVAALQCWQIVDTSLTYLWRIVSHRADASGLGGPIGMAQMAKSAASHGFYELIYLAALISVSIGLINLFPIPVLDGGHLLYYAFEGVMGRPLDVRVQNVGFGIGLVLVIFLMVFATWNDLVR